MEIWIVLVIALAIGAAILSYWWLGRPGSTWLNNWRDNDWHLRF
jgi:peptidoglycan/LPS O-acetylase OafA/YrhL